MKDIHHYDRNLEASLKNIETVSKANQKFIKEFLHRCELEEISKGRIARYGYLLTRISKWLGKDFDKANKKDIEDLVLRFGKEYTNAWTIKDYKVLTRKFFRSIGKNDMVSWIKITIKRNNDENLPNEVYTQEEIEKLIEVANNPKDKAMISVLYDLGCRISEFLNIRLKDITFEQDYAMVNVMGKTGNRSVPISKSVPYLKAWLNYSKITEGKDKEAYIFDIKYNTIMDKLKTLFERAGIDKPFNPHQFRHSRATELAKQLTEAQMNQFFGWTQASRMASTYVHLSGRDLIPKLIIESKKQKCFKCGSENPMDLKFCSKCLSPLDSKEFKKKQKDVEIEEIAYEASRDPRYEEIIRDIMKRRGLLRKL